MTAVILNVNRRYKAHAGIRLTGLPDDELRIIPVEGLPEIAAGDDLAALVAAERVASSRTATSSSWRRRSSRRPRAASSRLDERRAVGRRRVELAGDDDDPRHIEVILREAARIVRVRGRRS